MTGQPRATRRPPARLASFLLLPSLLSLLGIHTREAVEVQPPQARPEAAAVTTPEPSARPSPFASPARPAPEAPVPVPPQAPAPTRPASPPDAVTGPSMPASPRPIPAPPARPPVAATPRPEAAAPEPSGPPAKPPAPPPTGLTPQPIAPVLKGPAIPVPTKKPENWGRDDWNDEEDAEEDAEEVTYAGIVGTVKDSQTKKPLKDVEVSLPELDLRALTDSQGQFMIRGVRVRPLPYELLFKQPSYQTRFEKLKFEAKGTRTMDFELTPLGW